MKRDKSHNTFNNVTYITQITSTYTTKNNVKSSAFIQDLLWSISSTKDTMTMTMTTPASTPQ